MWRLKRKTFHYFVPVEVDNIKIESRRPHSVRIVQKRYFSATTAVFALLSKSMTSLDEKDSPPFAGRTDLRGLIREGLPEMHGGIGAPGAPGEGTGD
jgi:hypothetical protein